MADLGNQLKVQLQINEALKERQKLLENNSKLLGKQADLASSMCSSLDCNGLKNLEKSAGSFKNALTDAANQARDGLDRLNEKSEETSEVLEKVYKKASKLAVITSALKGFNRGFKLGTNIIKGFGKAIFGVVKSLFKLGKAIIMVPFQILSGMISMANKQGISPFRKELENLRKELGDFTEGPAAATKDAVYSIRKSFNDSKSSAVSFGRVFGYGPEGMAKALADTLEIAKSMGPYFETFIVDIGKGIGDFTKYQKGLGLSAETAAKFAVKMSAAGEDVNKNLHQIGNMSIQLGKQFNLSSKGIGRDITQMSLSMEHFGGMSVAQLGALSATMRRTGIEMKTLQGIVDHFDNFENAARSAAMLRRQFGMMIDSRKMMTMNAAERQEYLREQFKKTGKSFEGMSRIEQKAFAANLKMSVQEAAVMFGKGNRQKKLTDAQKAANKAQANQIEQTKVLKELSKNIEKQFSEGTKYESFWAAFTGGIEKGVRRTSEFRTLMINLKASLRTVELAGIRIGRAFVKSFPGVKGMLKSMSDFFAPGRITSNMNRVTRAFQVFFDSIKNPRGVSRALDNLFKEIKSIFSNFFGGGDKGFTKFADVFITIVGNIKLRLMAKAAESAASFIDSFTNGLESLMSGGGISGSVSGVADSIGSGFSDRFGESFANLSDTIRTKLLPALERAGPVVIDALIMISDKIKDYLSKKEVADKIFKGMSKTLKFLWDMKLKFLGYLWENEKGLLFTLAATTLGPAIAGGILSGLGSMLVTKLGTLLAGGTTAAAASGGITKSITGWFTKSFSKIKSMPKGNLIKGGGAAAVAIAVMQGFSNAWERASEDDATWQNISAAFGAKAIESLTFGLLDSDAIEDWATGSQRVAKKLSEELSAATKTALEGQMKELQPHFASTRKLIEENISKFEDLTGRFTRLKNDVGKNLSSADKDILDRMKKASGRATDLSRQQKEQQKVAEKTAEQAKAITLQTLEAIKKGKGTVYDSDAVLGGGKDFTNRQLFDTAHFLKGYMRSRGVELSESQIAFENGVMTIDDDIYQKQGKMLEEGLKAFEAKKIKEAQVDFREIENAYADVSVTEMQQLFKSISKDSPNSPELSALTEAISQKTTLDTMKQILEKHSVSVGKEGVHAAFEEFMKTKGESDRKDFEQLVSNAKKQALSSLDSVREADAQAQKLGQLEAAQDTIKRIKALEKIPEELATAQEAFAKIKVEDIESKITGVFTKVGKMSGVITKAITDAGLETKKEIISPTVMSNFSSIKEAREAIDAVIGKKTVTKDLVETRKSNIIKAFEAVGEIHKELAKVEFGSLDSGMHTKLTDVKLSALEIVGEKGLYNQYKVDGLTKKIKGTKEAVTAINELAQELNKVPELVAVLNIGEGFTQGKDIKVEIQKHNVALNVQVNIDAKKFVQEIVEVEIDKKGELGKQRIATTALVAAAKE